MGWPNAGGVADVFHDCTASHHAFGLVAPRQLAVNSASNMRVPPNQIEL
jgi:hypothetical protein